MKRILLIFAAFLLSVTTTFAGEQVDLTTPVVKSDLTYYKLDQVVFDWRRSYVIVRYSGTDGEVLEHIYSEATAGNILKNLNKADFSVKSFQKQVMERLVTDDVFDGTVTGTPD